MFGLFESVVIQNRSPWQWPSQWPAESKNPNILSPRQLMDFSPMIPGFFPKIRVGSIMQSYGSAQRSQYHVWKKPTF